jgi:hypothetical protein
MLFWELRYGIIFKAKAGIIRVFVDKEPGELPHYLTD